MRLSKNKILGEISRQYGIDRKYIDLQKTEGFYYWSGDITTVVRGETCTFYQTLGDVSLERWVSDFKELLDGWESSDGEDINTVCAKFYS